MWNNKCLMLKLIKHFNCSCKININMLTVHCLNPCTRADCSQSKPLYSCVHRFDFSDSLLWHEWGNSVVNFTTWNLTTWALLKVYIYGYTDRCFRSTSPILLQTIPLPLWTSLTRSFLYCSWGATHSIWLTTLLTNNLASN